MELVFNIIILLLSIAALWLGAVWIVESAPRLAQKLGISDLVIGLTVIAFGTSAPEFAVTITAAIKHQADISVGNIVGSNIFNLGFILGGVALLRTIKTTKKMVFREGSLLLGISIILLFFLSDYEIALWEGLLLIGSLVVYLIYLFVHKEPLEEDINHGPYRWYHSLQLVGGLLFVVAGGHFLVDSASILARAAGLSDWAIAVTVVAAGTSAPEFATSLMAAIKGHHGISAGNLIGSDLFNIMGVLGLAAILRPLHVDSSAPMDILLLVGLVLTVVIMMRTGWKISRWEGFLLIVINLARWIFTLKH
ncbi:MAG: sodium:calcium antiporter [Caldisericaceae bacterium]|nr:sodium:calcium antiporter [Caldisericaceae bacterium]